MATESLADFLDPNNNQLTVEGYPTPLRATLVAKKSKYDGIQYRHYARLIINHN